MNEQLVGAIVAAAKNLHYSHDYTVRDDCGSGPIDSESCSMFVDVMYRHIEPVMSGWKESRIAMLKAELAALEGKNDE